MILQSCMLSGFYRSNFVHGSKCSQCLQIIIVHLHEVQQSMQFFCCIAQLQYSFSCKHSACASHSIQYAEHLPLLCTVTRTLRIVSAVHSAATAHQELAVVVMLQHELVHNSSSSSVQAQCAVLATLQSSALTAAATLAGADCSPMTSAMTWHKFNNLNIINFNNNSCSTSNNSINRALRTAAAAAALLALLLTVRVLTVLRFSVDPVV
jgi:hypothetical protein